MLRKDERLPREGDIANELSWLGTSDHDEEKDLEGAEIFKVERVEFAVHSESDVAWELWGIFNNS